MSFDEAISFENLLEAGEKCCKGCRWKPSIQNFEMHMLSRTGKVWYFQVTDKYKPMKTNDFILHERGKERHIKAHHVNDRQVYKSYCMHELVPLTQNYIMENNSASQEGKGTDHAIKLFRKGLAHAYKVCKGNHFYVVTYDFHDYFNSIDQDLTIAMLEFTDKRSEKFFKDYAALFEHGFGIGGEPSQRIAITYPSSIDRMISCNPKVIASGRYMDDGWAIVKTKQESKELIKDIKKQADKLKLTLNQKHTTITDMSKHSTVFLKKRTKVLSSGKIVMQLVRKNIRDKLRTIKIQKNDLDNGKMPFDSILQSFVTWCSYAGKYNSNKQMLRVGNMFAETFNYPWDDVLYIINKGEVKNER